MKKVKHITEEGTLEVVEAHLKEIFVQLKHITAAIRASGEKNDFTLILHNATEMAATQVYRLSLWLNERYDMIAWVARNLLELDLLLRYALSGEENLKRLIADYLVDAIEIDKGFMGLSSDAAYQDPYRQRIREYEEDAVHRGLTLEKQPIRTSHIAAEVGMEAEYKAFHKINSKYVHPTSWRLIGVPDRTDTTDIKNVFLAQSQLYALDILNRISAATNIAQAQPVTWRVVVMPDP